MAIVSMTGFARAEGAVGRIAWAWELRSVNGRGLELRCRVPPGRERHETAFRRLAGERLQRGNVSASLNVTTASRGAVPSLNRAALDQVLGIVDRLMIEAGGRFERPRLDGLLGLRGVVELQEEQPSDEDLAAEEAAIEAGLVQALDALVQARVAEGERLTPVVGEQIDAIAALGAAARDRAPAQTDQLRERLRAQLAEVLAASDHAVPEDRFLQEAAMLAIKADVREELDRLDAHVASARAMLAEGGTVGRRFDFLSQEFNREANTLCSKSVDVELTRIGMDLKLAIDRFREQVQNLE